MGDEFGAAGGFDRLQGNNKAISACHKSGEEAEEETQEEDINHSSDGCSSLFFRYLLERQFNCPDRRLLGPE